MLLDDDDLTTLLVDAGETFVLGDSSEFTGVFNHATNDEGMIRGGQTTVLAKAADTECIAIGDSVYRQVDEPPVEYVLRDRMPDGLDALEMLVLEKQDAT